MQLALSEQLSHPLLTGSSIAVLAVEVQTFEFAAAARVFANVAEELLFATAVEEPASVTAVAGVRSVLLLVAGTA